MRKIIDMKTLQEIKNTYAQNRFYDDWDELANSVQDDLEYEAHWTEICIRAQKAALEKAAENVKMLATDFNCDCGQTHTDWNVNKESITNAENLIQ